MRCSSLSFANGLKLAALQTEFRSERIAFNYFGDAISQQLAINKHIYYFSNGTIVTWNLNRHEIHRVLTNVKKYRVEPYRHIEEDHFSYKITPGEKINIRPHHYFNVELITLGEDDEETRLSVAYALSQSIKLKSYEDQIETLVKEHVHLIRDLANEGNIKLPRKKILKIMGKIFIAKQQVNLASEYHNPPKFFWNHSNVEGNYLLIANYMDIPKRVAGLNKKLDTLNEMFDMLNTQLQHQHSSVLETIIILLIVIEIVFSVMHFWF